MNWIVDIATSGGVGSIIGLLGGLVSKFTEVKQQKQEYLFQLKKMELAIRESELEHSHEIAMADKGIERAQVEGEIQVEGKEVEAFTASIRTANDVSGWLRAVRPAITFYLLLASTALFAVVWSKIGGLSSFSPEELGSLLRSMIESAIFLTITGVSWWFASRGGNIKK